MKRYFYLVAAILCMDTALADDFSSRLGVAKRLEASIEGGQYVAALAPFIGAAMGACIPAGVSSPENLGEFVLVGDVSRSGKLANVEVRPRTKIALCFMRHFGQAQLPDAPKASGAMAAYPIYVEMRVTP